MPAMTFDRRFREVVVEKRVVLEFGEFEFLGMEVKRSLENAEGLSLVEHSYREEVADLEDKAASFLKQHDLSMAEVLSKRDNLLLGRKMRLQVGDGLFRILRKLRKGASEFMHGLKTLVQNHVIE